MTKNHSQYHLLISPNNSINSISSIDIEDQDQEQEQESSEYDDDDDVKNTIATNTKTIKRERHYYAVALYGITTMLLCADQNLIAPNMSAIAKEFQFDDMQRDYYLGGHIALGFFLVGAPASYVVGAISDNSSTNRSQLFALMVLVGEGACMATFFTTNYLGLYVTRVLTGFSIGGAIPIIYSLLGDLFATQDRNLVTAVVGMGTGCGIAFGQGIAGWIGSVYGWRLPFLIISIPALACALLISLTVQDPLRGGMDKTDAHIETTTSADYTPTNNTPPPPPTTTTVNINNNSHSNNTALTSSTPIEDDSISDDDDDNDDESISSEYHYNNISDCCYNTLGRMLAPTFALLRIPTVLLVLLQGAPGCLPWGIVNTYLNDYFSTEKQMSVQAATSLILVFGLGNFLGMSIGGWGGNVLYSKDVRYPHLLSGLSAILGILPMLYMINSTTTATSTITNKYMISSVVAAILAGIGSGVTGPIVKATLTNVTLPTSRGTAFALLNTFDDFGRGLGPLFIAMLIKLFQGNRQKAFNVGILGWLLCGFANLAIFVFAKNDQQHMLDELKKLQQRLKESDR